MDGGGSLAGEFISGAGGPLFLLARRPARPRGCVLVVPPFAEEMNKCRRLFTCLGQQLCRQDTALVLIDLFGTGDSSGDFSEADWETWQQDLSRAADACADRGLPVTGLLATRLGAALAVAAMRMERLPEVARTVMWQPVFDGSRFMQQFLRLRIAASLAADRTEKLADLRAQLAAGGIVEVAGYGLPGALSTQIDACKWPEQLPAGFGRVRWFEMLREAGSSVPPQVTQLVERSRAAGRSVDMQAMEGEPFWAATEIVEHPPLVAATAEAFLDTGP